VPPNRAGFLLVAAAGALADLAVSCPVLAGPAQARALEAAYLFKLTPFVDWPANVFASPADPFRLCVVGEDPFGASLDLAGQGQSTGHHPIIILRLKSATPADHCQLMFVAGDAQFVSQSLSAVSGTPVLTVTDGQTGDKGVVNFVVGENRVQLQIDQQGALKNHLSVSSKLLDVAAPPEGNAP
jgi:hypothetical protein